MGMYGSRAVTLLVLISDDVINRILKLDIQTNILVYVTRCCTDLTSKVLKERTFCQSSALLHDESCKIIYVYMLLVQIRSFMSRPLITDPVLLFDNWCV